MADGPKIQGEVSLSTEGVESALNRVAAAGETMATRLQQGADKAGKAVDGIGSGAAASVDQFTRAESRMNDAIQQKITSLQLLGKTASQKFEFKIDAQGLDATKFEPILVKLREAEKQAAASSAVVSSSLNNIGMSAAATATAMRGVPAQMTDIIVSLQSGQAPLTVLMQQGGQLKDMFGGVGNAAKAMGSYIAGMVNPLTLTAAAAGTLGYAFYAGSEESKGLAQSIILTGNAAGQSVGSLYKMADAIAATTGATKGASVDALGQVMATGKVAAENLTMVAEAAVTMERATGTAVKDTVAQFAELGKSPVQASVKLNEQYGYLTASVYSQIKALEEQGKTQEAVALAQTTFANAIEGMSSKAVENAGYIERAWRGVKDAIKSAGDELLNVGRQDTLEKQLERAIARRDGSYNYKSRVFVTADKSVEAQNAVDVIQKQIAARDMLAKYEADSIATEKQKIAQIDAAGKLREKYQTKEVQREKEIDAINKSILTAKEKSDAIALVNEKYKDKPVTVRGANDDVSQTYAAQLSAEKSFAAAQIALVKERVSQRVRTEEEGAQDVVVIEQAAFEREKAILSERLKLTTDKGERAKIKQQIEEIGSASEVSVQKYVTAITKLNDARSKMMADALAGYGASTSKIADENAQLREQIDTLGMTAQQLGEYEASKIRAAAAAEYLDAASLREAASTMEAAGIAADSVKYYRDLAVAREAAGKALSDKATLTAQKGIKQSAIEAEKEWSKTADKIGDSITDALMRGFESGKSFAVTLRDTVVNMFKTMVLQPTIKVVVVGGLSAVGMGSAAAGDSTIGYGSYGNLASLGNSAYNLYNGGSSLYGSFANSGIGASLGLSAGLSSSLGVAGGAGSVMGSSAALAAAEATSAGATAMTSLGSTVGAAIPYVGAALLAITALTGALGKRGGAKTEGDAYGTLTGSSLSLAAADRTGDNWITGTNSNSVVESLLTPIGTSVSGLIKSMGGSANGLSFNLGYSTDTKGTAKDNIQSGVMDAAGNYVYRNGRNAERGTYSTELNLEVQRMMVAAVKAADVSWVYKDIAGSIDLYSASAEQLQTVLSQLAQVTTLRAAFDTLGFGADKLSKSLIDASGGASALSSNLDSYYQNFYTESERQAKTLAQVGASMSDLGLNMPTTREGFRALVEAQDLTTDSGQKTFAALMSLNSAFASAVPATTAAATAVEAISDAMKSLQADTAKLQVELLAAQGKTAEATAAQRAIDTSGMTSAEAAVYDYNAALRAQIDALNAAKDAETARLSERASLEKELLSVQGNNVALRELERQALDESNRALFDQIRAIEDQQAAAQGAASAANEAFAAAQAATSTALAAVQKSVDVERKAYEASVAAERTRLNASRDVAQEAVSTVKSVLSALNSNITDLYASVDSASAQSAAAGNAFIDSALSAVRKSGYLPDADALSSAISAARGGLNANGYASQFEYERATLTLAGKLSQLKDAGSSQLSVAEQSLAAANAQLEALDSAAKFAESQFDATISAAQAQVDALNGVDTSVLSVKDAIAALSNAILAQQAAQSKTPAGLASGLYAGNSAAIANPSASDLAYWTNLITQNGYDATKTQFDSDVTRINAQQAQIKSWYAGNPDAIKNPSASDVTYWMKKIDAMGAEAAKAEFTADVKRLVPHLATGTNYVPQDMLAFVHEGEQITPKPYNPALSGARDTQRLERLVEALTTEVQRLQGVVAAGNQHARRTADAVNGNPEQPMLVETV